LPRRRPALAGHDGALPFLSLSRLPALRGHTAAHDSVKLGNLMNTKQLLVLAAASAISLAGRASGWAADGVFAEIGLAPSGSYSVTAGALWSWKWRGSLGNTEATAVTEVFLSGWDSHGAAQRQTLTQLGVLPLLRLRLDHGRSPWFLEGGIGISVMDNLYRNHGKQFSTRFNFVDVFGIGRSIGADRRREVSLRLAHVSNADIRQPNPGENFLQLRYAAMF
jgi:lipid A 3-O-deacylase